MNEDGGEYDLQMYLDWKCEEKEFSNRTFVLIPAYAKNYVWCNFILHQVRKKWIT